MDHRQNLNTVNNTSYTQKLNLTMPIFIFITILSVYILQYSIYLIQNNFLDKAIKVTTLILLFISIKNYKLSHDQQGILLIYGALFGSALVGAILTLDIMGILQLSKIVYMFLVFPVILLICPPKTKPPGMLLKMPIFWGLLFSLQSIIIFTLILFNAPIEPQIIEIGRRPGITALSYGILGYGGSIYYLQDGIRLLRVHGWFAEPSHLAAFLLYPAFVSFGYYLSTKKKYYLLISFLCFVSMIMTFSLAGFLAGLVSIIFLIVIRPDDKKSGRKPGFSRYVAPIIAVAIFFLSAQFIMSKLNYLYIHSADIPSYVKFLGRDPEYVTGRLFREYYKQDLYIDILKGNPLGIGLGHTLGTNESTSTNAFIYWAVSGGVPAIIILLILYYKLFFSYCLPLLESRYSPYRFIGAAFVGISVHGLSYGNWVYPFYLYTVAVTILCANKIKKQDKKSVHRVKEFVRDTPL